MPDASWGYTAEERLKAILGGEGIDRIREGAMSPSEMRAYIEAAPRKRNVSYSDEARRFAKAVLKIADKDQKGFLIRSQIKDYNYGKIVGGNYDLTGFMYGWAVNAVRYVLSASPIENPAIVTIRG